MSGFVQEKEMDTYFWYASADRSYGYDIIIWVSLATGEQIAEHYCTKMSRSNITF